LTGPGDVVAWLDETLDALGLDKLHLIGYSEGGGIAARHAATTSKEHRLQSLFVIEPDASIYPIRRRLLVTIILKAVRVFRARDKEQAVRNLSDYLSPGVTLSDHEVQYVLTAFQTYRQRLPPAKALSDAELKGLDLPVLLMLAEHTVLYDPGAVAERASRLLPDVEVKVYPGAGHGLPFQFPEQTAADILDFLHRHNRTPSTEQQAL